MIVLKGGKIFTGEEFIENGAIFIENGKIVKVLRRKRLPSNVEVIDLKGKYILPGFIDPHTHIGMRDEGAPRDYSDVNEATDPATPHIYAIDAYNPLDPAVEKALRNGVTTVFITPGSANPIGGIGSVIKLKKASISEIIVKKEAGLKMALGENPKLTYRERKSFPTTRMATAAVIREWFTKAQRYGEEKKRKEKDPKLENILKALRKEIPCRIHCHSVQDIETALRLREEFGFEMILEHASDAPLIADKLKGKVKGIVVGPLFGVSSKPESKNLSFENPARLSSHGIPIAITSDHPFNAIYYLNLYAAMSFKEGLDEITALKAITSTPAEFLGVSDRVGYIKKGYDADIVVFSGHPFDIMSRVEMVFIDGVRVV
uniref:Amidohydrolase n=2 Tax=candidate division WOR-3 bacterium TaxID=2052148 RepID=A0A7V3ZZY3_UNCW3